MSELIDKQAAVDIAKELTITVEGYEMHNQAVMNYCAEIMQLPSIQPDTTTHDSIPAETGKNDGDRTSGDCISRRESLEKTRTMQTYKLFSGDDMILVDKAQVQTELMMLPSVQPDLGKYEYHYDHTDCIWYRPEARNRCPVTCAQYRDGWNDAMNYIFRDGKGYRPYRRGGQYEE